MVRFALLATIALTLGMGAETLAQSTPPPSSAPKQQSGRPVRQLPVTNKPWTGDFDKMLERRVIRVVAPYSRSLYFTDKGREQGLSAELVRDFERYLNTKYKKRLGKRPLTIILSPATRDRLLTDVVDGYADIGLGNLTVTEERLGIVDMVADDLGFREVLLTGPKSPAINSLDDLSGKTIHVRPSSSYHESLLEMNAGFRRAGKPEANLVLVPDALEDEDMMEMLSIGLFQAMVIDDWKAKMWGPVMPSLTLHPGIVLRDDIRTGWAIRKDSPQLTAALKSFYKNWVKKQGVVPYRLQQYMKRVKELKDPTGSDEWKRFEDTLELFERYAGKYNFDPLMLVAQGYQESQLKQSARSHVGAVGVMQVMPATGAQMAVGDILMIEPNIHAGAKYLDHLMTQYFADANFTEANRALFAFASYNAGPSRVVSARKRAAKRGLDPNQWFNNVEIVVGERVGIETTAYVRNIYKYYVAYRLIAEAQQRSQQSKDAVVPK